MISHVIHAHVSQNFEYILKGIIDFEQLMALLGFESCEDFKDAHGKWVDSAMPSANGGKENKWK